MTTAVLSRLTHAELDALYASARADRLPVGTFTGQAFTRWPVGWIWQGKVFFGAHVYNRIRGYPIIGGHVTQRDGEVLIDYPQLHLQDRLKPLSATLWLGQLRLFGRTWWFTLEAEP